MIKEIAYFIPETSLGKKFFDILFSLLSELPNKVISKNSLILKSSNPLNAFPITSFSKKDIFFPEIHFDDNKDLSLNLGNFCINTHLNAKPNQTFSIIEQQRKDTLGPYIEIKISNSTLFRLPIEELYKRLTGHIVRIDHTGINIPSVLVNPEKWEIFIQKLSKQTNMYKYPTGEEWPFILPATSEEFRKDINRFPLGREPKFELVYERYSPIPAIQIDIETDLSREEVEKLFPEPYGVSFPGLAEYFRTVYVHHEWVGLNIRFDIRYKSDKLENDWTTGKWLVKDGGRI